MRWLTLTSLLLLACACGGLEDPGASAVRSGLGSTTNAVDCPRDWATARNWCNGNGPDGLRCAPIGTQCWYPEMGDMLPSGRWADALLGCYDPAGGTGAGGNGEWRCAQ